MHTRIVIFSILFAVQISVTQNQLQRCECVPNNRCFPNLQVDGGGELDIRIVSGNSTSGPSPTSPTSTCTNGLISCCTECGVVYNITSAPKPAAGQGLYGAQPWQTVILDSKFNYLGGGVLIDEKHVLTAAHKVYEFQNATANVQVRLGVWDAGNKIVEPYKTQNSSVSKIFIHAQYSNAAKNLFNDVAILRLATPIRYGPTVNPAINTACLPTSTSDFNNLRCSVSGWGKNAFNGSYQSIIKEVDVPVVNNAECETRLKTTRLGPQFKLDAKSFMCAGGEVGKDACVGDGGSPLICKVKDRYQVAGLVAWGIGCANGNIPGVYVRVQSYLDFINTSMKAA